jgi:hypothetical protein
MPHPLGISLTVGRIMTWRSWISSLLPPLQTNQRQVVIALCEKYERFGPYSYLPSQDNLPWQDQHLVIAFEKRRAGKSFWFSPRFFLKQLPFCCQKCKWVLDIPHRQKQNLRRLDAVGFRR